MSDKNTNYMEASMELETALANYIEACNKVEIYPITGVENYMHEAGCTVEIRKI